MEGVAPQQHRCESALYPVGGGSTNKTGAKMAANQVLGPTDDRLFASAGRDYARASTTSALRLGDSLQAAVLENLDSRRGSDFAGVREDVP